MHFVLWGLHQHERLWLVDTMRLFQCTSCFGVFINCRRGLARPRARVSMHFVLWGLHQLRAFELTPEKVLVSMHFVLWGLHQLW